MRSPIWREYFILNNKQRPPTFGAAFVLRIDQIAPQTSYRPRVEVFALEELPARYDALGEGLDALLSVEFLLERVLVLWSLVVELLCDLALDSAEVCLRALPRELTPSVRGAVGVALFSRYDDELLGVLLFGVLSLPRYELPAV